MKRDNRAAALSKLENTAQKEKELWYRRICDYALAYHLSADDRTWLYNKLKAKGVTILGMDPTAEPEVRRKTWHDEDGTEYVDYSHKDYETIYDEIVKECDALRPLVEKVRRIRPPQRYEMEAISQRIREGDEKARERLTEMYLRTALGFGLRWSKLMDVDLQEAVGDAFEGLVRAVHSYSPDNGGFSMYLFCWMRNTTERRLAAHDPLITIRKNQRSVFVKAYYILKKWGCLGCDRLQDCDKAVQKVAVILNCELEDARTAIRSSSEPLSLEAYLETAGHTICEGRSEDIREEEDGSPVYEEGLSGYCVDAAEEAETGLTDWLLQKKLREQMNRLTPREKEILEYHYGIRCGRSYKLEEIGCKYGVSRARIQQIETMAMEKLRVRSTMLKDYLSDKRSDRDKQMMQKKLQIDGMRLEKELSKKRLRRNSMKLSELLINYRTEYNLNRKKMAELCELSETTLSRLEEPGNANCPISKVLLKLFTNMEISEDVFMEVIKHDKLFHGKDLAWMWEERNEKRLLKYFRQMNKQGKEIALTQAQVLAELTDF